MSDLISLTASPLDVPAAIAHCVDPAAGGIDVFIGTTRAEARDGRELLALQYEAYADMATRQMQALAADALSRWPIARLAILHRTGRVAVGEASVVIVVSASHRGQAFDACRFLIDQLKQSVTIWKKEEWSAGDATWVAGATPKTSGPSPVPGGG